MKLIKIVISILLLIICLYGCAKPGIDTISTEIESQPESTTENTKEKKTVTSLSANGRDFKEFVKINGRTFIGGRSVRALYFNYSMSGFEFAFYGTGAEAELVSSLGNGGEQKNGVLYVYVDDMTNPAKQIYLNEKDSWYSLADDLEPGEHHIKISKRTDISYSSSGVVEIKVKGENATFIEKPASKIRKIEFLGDSITSGDGVLGSNGGSLITENQDAHFSYANVTAEYFDAEIIDVSRCGLGMVWNSSQKAPEDGGVSLPMIYEYCNYYDDSSRTKWDFSSYVPDIIVINIGTNDKTQVLKSSESKERWMNTYYDFLKLVRENEPNIPIICCYGSMLTNDQDLGLESVINKLKGEGFNDLYYLRFPENNIRSFGIGAGSHPSVKKQRYDAEEFLIPLIKEIKGW